MFEQVVYLDDKRYAGPACHPPPAEVKGLPTQRELDAFPRMFTWGELKDIIQRGDLEALMRNKPMQSRYDEWMVGMKVQYGSTENYLRTARLPWTAPSPQPGSSTSEIGTLAQSDTAEPAALPPGLAPSTVPAPGRALDALSTVATPGGGAAGRGAGSASGAATPSSAGFVSLASLKLVNGKLRRANGKVSADQAGIAGSGASAEASGSSSPGTGSGSASPRGGDVEKGPAAEHSAHEGKEEAGEDEEEGEGDDEPPVYLRYDAERGLDTDKYAVLYNDWPYNVPYGVSHHCVWSRVPIAHPELVDYDPEDWARIEQEGLGGFTGITPLRSFRIPSPPSSAGLPSPPAEPAEPVDPNAPSPPSTIHGKAAAPSPLAPEIVFTQDMVGRQKYIGRIREKDWYAADIAYSGPEARRWAGVGYMAKGAQEIDKMVRGLWDERGWECLWFVNPPRLQSVPGFSHFHVFARRKTPQEIDASEAFWRDG